MELYKLPKESRFRLLNNPQIPPGAYDGDMDQTYTFKKVDGMYCPCYGEDGKRYYFAAWTEVERIEE